MKSKVLLILFIATILAVPASAQKKKINTEKSVLMWTGKKVTGQHHGSVQLESGWFKLEDNKMAGGEFVIDMSTIVDDDLEGDNKTKLENHLKSDDFFGVKSHPTSKLVITESEPVSPMGFKVIGNLTIKGTTHPIEFNAKKVDNKYLATIIVDRSKYDVRYGSSSFFDNLGDKVIYDDFTLEVVLHTK